MGVAESSIALKQSVFGLWHKGDISPADNIWEKFYALPDSADDIFQLISHNDLRELTLNTAATTSARQIEPRKNLETLLYNVVARLQLILSGSLHASLQPSDVNKQILNCMRILTRIFPFIYEAPHLRAWQSRFFWQPRKPTAIHDAHGTVIGSLYDGLDVQRTFPLQDSDLVIDQPLGKALIDTLIELCFFPGFAVPKRQAEDGSLDLSIQIKLWQTGIGVPSTNQPANKEHERNQYEIVRLFLALASGTMYLPPSQVAVEDNEALTYVTTQLRSTTLHGVVCSLMNTVLKYHPYTWNVPIELPDSKKDPKKMLVSSAVQLLLVLVIYRVPESANTGDKNAFRNAVGKLYKPADFQFIHEGMREVLSPPVNVSLISIPGKDKQLAWAPEMISLLWELFQANRRFRKYLIDLNSAMDYIVLLLFYALDAINNDMKQNALRMCVAVLQDLTYDEAFCKKLNMVFPYHDTLPAIMRVNNFHGTYADFLICSIHKIYFATKGKSWSADRNLVFVLLNTAPHLIDIGRATSIKLLEIYADLAAPTTLLANGENWVELHIILLAIERILKCHPKANRRFVEAVVANAGRFKALQAITLEGALAEADRQARERKDRGQTIGRNSADSQRIIRPSISRTSTVSTTLSQRHSLDEASGDNAFTIGDDEVDQDDSLATSVASLRQSSHLEQSIPQPGLSEKAQGKQPARMNQDTSNAQATEAPIPSSAATYDSSSTQVIDRAFSPSQTWLESWHSQLPLDSILKFIRKHETDQLQKIDQKKPLEVPMNDGRGVYDDTAQQRASSKGEPFEWTSVAIAWYHALIWSRIYLQEAETFQGAGGLYASTDVRLFKRAANNQQITLRSPKGAIDAVGASLAQRISSFSMK